LSEEQPQSQLIDDRVRELFQWVKNEERQGRIDLAEEIAKRAGARYGLQLRGAIRWAVGISIEISFVGTKLIIRHDGSEWQLLE